MLIDVNIGSDKALLNTDYVELIYEIGENTIVVTNGTSYNTALPISFFKEIMGYKHADIPQ